jgi:hypothetical protein
MVTTNPSSDNVLHIAKPKTSALDQFKSKRKPDIANVATLLSELPVYKIARAKDFVRLHPDEETYWTDELCFVNIPIHGQKDEHTYLINEDIAMTHLEADGIIRYRLALATKPNDCFFLCAVPTTNLDNTWNSENLKACELAKERWVKVSSRKSEGVEGYKTQFAVDEDAFPAPEWPKQTLEDLVGAAFAKRMITDHDDPGLKRLIGAKQSAK